MQGGHGAMLTFNPNGENTQVDCGPLGKKSFNGNLSVKSGLWKKGHNICITPLSQA